MGFVEIGSDFDGSGDGGARDFVRLGGGQRCEVDREGKEGSGGGGEREMIKGIVTILIVLAFLRCLALLRDGISRSSIETVEEAEEKKKFVYVRRGDDEWI